MDGFVLLDEVDGGGAAWVRLRHVTAVRVVSYQDGSSPEQQHLVYVLAGGRWFVDPVPRRTRELAEARASVIAGTGGRLWTRARSAFTSLVRPP